jgi:hypothetical protein
MVKRQKKLRIGFFILALLGIFFVLGKGELFSQNQLSAISEKELSAEPVSSCVFEEEAQKYLEDIYQFSPDHFGASKPKLVFNQNDVIRVGNKVALGKEDGKNITIYEKGFQELYGENCSSTALARLQSTIAHEYAHHIDFDSGAILKTLDTDSLEYSAELGGEHALFELVWQKTNPKAPPIDEKGQIKVSELKKILTSI